MAIQISGTTVIDNDKKFLNTYHSNGTKSAAFDIDLDTATVHAVTITGTNIQMNFIGNPPVDSFFSWMVIITQGSGGDTLATTGDYGAVLWTDAQAPFLSETSGQVDVLSFWTVDGANTVYGSFVGANMS